MGLDVYTCLVIALPREKLTNKIEAGILDDMVEEGELTGYQYNEDKSKYHLIGIPVIKTINVIEEEFSLINLNNLLNEINESKEKFKKITGLDGDLIFVSRVSY